MRDDKDDTSHEDGAGQAGLQLPGYRLGEVIGRGGFATVYLAEQLSLGRQVAVKVLMADLATESHRRRFDREREILVRLGAHPHVVDVHDAGLTPENRPYIVMRLYRAGSLATRLQKDGPLPPDQAVTLMTKMAAALDNAHAMGVLHRDVKPENVLLSDTGEPALSDFGISAITEREGTRTSTTFFTMSHAAPEVLNGHQFSVASDIYALASTTYQLLAGRPAFDGAGLAAMRRIVGAAPPPIARPDIPPALEAVVQRGMAKDPTHRYHTAGGFAHDLTNALNPPPGWTPPPAPPLPPTPVPPPPVTPPEPQSPPGPQAPLNRRPAVLVGALVAVLALGGGAYALTGDDKKTDPVAHSSTNPPAGPSSTDTSGSTDPSDSSSASDASDSPGASGSETTADASGGGGDLTPLPATKTIMSKEHLFAMDIDPKTGRIATPTGDKVLVWDPTTGAQVQQFQNGMTDNTFGVTYRSDGAVLYGVGDRSLRSWATTGPATPRPLGTGGSGWWQMRATPDGARVVTSGRDTSPQIGLWDTSKSAQLSTIAFPSNVQDVEVTPDGRYILVMLADQVSVLDMGSARWTAQPASTRTIPFPEALETGTRNFVGTAISPDGKTVATSAPGGPIQLWDLATGKATTTLESGWVNGRACDMAFSPDGKRLITYTWLKAYVWDLTQGAVRWELDLMHDSANQVSFGNDNDTVVVVSQGDRDQPRTRSWVNIWKLPAT